MSNAVTLMKLFGFIALVSGLIVILATEPNFKELEPYRTNWDHLQEQLAKNPLGDRPPDLTQPDIDFTAEETRWCLIAEYCPDIPLWSDLADSVIDTGSAIMAWARTFATFVAQIFTLITWLGDMAWTILNILVLAITFTIPGIPFYAQLLLWVVNMSMWVAMVYIAFQAITGAISGGVPF